MKLTKTSFSLLMSSLILVNACGVQGARGRSDPNSSPAIATGSPAEIKKPETTPTKMLTGTSSLGPTFLSLIQEDESAAKTAQNVGKFSYQLKTINHQLLNDGDEEEVDTFSASPEISNVYFVGKAKDGFHFVTFVSAAVAKDFAHEFISEQDHSYQKFVAQICLHYKSIKQDKDNPLWTFLTFTCTEETGKCTNDQIPFALPLQYEDLKNDTVHFAPDLAQCTNRFETKKYTDSIGVFGTNISIAPDQHNLVLSKGTSIIDGLNLDTDSSIKLPEESLSFDYPAK